MGEERVHGGIAMFDPILETSSFSACYSLSVNKVSGKGFQLSSEVALRDYLRDRVMALWVDEPGTVQFEKALEGIIRTNFHRTQIAEVFEKPHLPESWQIGELLAQCLLEDMKGASFPWNVLRDLRSPNASLPGADIIGLVSTPSGVRFLFGEVKVSSDLSAPPGVMYGRTGMVKQLETLRDSRRNRHLLFRWLSYRMIGREQWLSLFQEAANAYISSSGSNVVLVGVLIRDTCPYVKDIESRVSTLAKGHSVDVMPIWLLAYYFSTPISHWPSVMMGGRRCGLELDT